jgi:putative copper resistance protein D
VTWVGGLIALFAIKQDVLKEAKPMVARYSSLALASFVIVGVSGLGSTYVRIPDAAGLFSPYGQMLFIKVVLLRRAAFSSWHCLKYSSWVQQLVWEPRSQELLPR